MVVTTGPCMSLEARGTLNDTITYAVLGRTCYAKSYFKPANPKSAAQIGVRTGTKFITSLWQQLSDVMKAPFEAMGQSDNLSPYHAFLKLNTRRWSSHGLPIVIVGNDYKATYTEVEVSMDVTNRLHEITLRIKDELNGPFCMEMCFNTSPDFTPSRSTTKAFSTGASYAWPNWIMTGSWTAPDDSTYYIKTRYGHVSGNASPFFPIGITS